MALLAYIAQTRSLLNDVGGVEYTTPDLTTFINDARVQIAGASEAIRFVGPLALVAANRGPYPFTSIITVPAAPAGTGGVLVVRKGAALLPGGGFSEVFNREWDWFFSYCLCGPNASQQGVPNTFSQLPPGSAGSLYFSPIPDGTVPSVSLDCVGYPSNLESDGDPEALPYPWTQAVQYYAAYLALLNAQRLGDADAMLQRYDLFQTRATQMTTPTTLPVQYPGQGGAALAGQARPITAARGGAG